MRELTFEFAGVQPFKYRIGNDLYEEFGQALKKELGDACQALIVTDQTVASRAAAKVTNSLALAGFAVFKHIIPFGKANRSLEKATLAIEMLADFHEGGNIVVVGVGPQPVLDVASCAAALYYPGVPVALVPTTPVAAQLSTSGHVRLHAGEAQGVAGLIVHPAMMLYDTDCEEDLGYNTIKDAYAFFAQAAFADSPYTFRRLHEDIAQLVAGDRPTYLDAITNAIYVRMKLAKDAEKGVDIAGLPALNFGATFAAALERALGPDTKNPGELLAEGLRFEARLAFEQLGLDMESVVKLDVILSSAGLHEIPCDLDEEDLYHILAETSAKDGEEFVFAIAAAPGLVEYVAVDEDIVIAHLEAFCQSRSLLLPYEKRPSAWAVASDELDEEDVEEWERAFNESTPTATAPLAGEEDPDLIGNRTGQAGDTDTVDETDETGEKA